MSSILRKNSRQNIRRTDSTNHLLRLTSVKGFSLIEIAVVMIIIGLIMTAGVTFFRSSILGTKLSTTKTNLDNIKTSVINFAMANGRLPCPDTIIPPNNIGTSNPDPTPVQNPTAGFCINNVCLAGNNCNCNCTATCVSFPCYVPFQTLQLQLPGGKDYFGNVFRYDISHEIVAGSGLTNTTQDTFCGLLFEYVNHATDVQPPATLPAPWPIVTNTNDPVDDGLIAQPGQGYGVAAVVISQSSVGNVFNSPPGLGGKNIAGSPREYEMANRANGPAYGDLVAEMTYNDLYNKVCTAQKTKIRIQNYTGVGNTVYAQFAGSTACIAVNPQNSGYIDIPQGTTVTFYNCQAACQGQCTTCTGCAGCVGTTCTTCTTCACSGCAAYTSCTGCAGGNCSLCSNSCGTPITFNMIGGNDAGATDWIGGPGTIPRDGRVRITGACALSDNTSPTP